MDKIDFRLLIINKTDSLGSITSKKTVNNQWINILKKQELRAHMTLVTRLEEPRAHIV